MLAQKNFGAKMENMLENQTNQREVFILISLLFITLFIRARRARVIYLPRNMLENYLLIALRVSYYNTFFPTDRGS